MSTDEKLDFLRASRLSRRDLRMAAKVASACGDLALAQRLRELHDADKEAARAEMAETLAASQPFPWSGACNA